MLSNLLKYKIDNCTIFNQICVVCRATGTRHGLCAPCLTMLPELTGPRCPGCASPSPQNQPCRACATNEHALDAIHASYEYCYPLAQIIQAFKYQKRMELAGALGFAMRRKLGTIPPCFDVVIAVPLSNERLAERGFNQSELLREALLGSGKSSGSPTWCWRKRNTLPQARLGQLQRTRNLENAFGVEHRCDGLEIAIVDDVSTTGSTLETLASELKKRGAKRVEAWVLARSFSSVT
ncbi:ComF family protein [Paludibacterium paludis]|uniref:ComF family protein n=1 Tax=Paludibacterium paludis TaxID=1225769 RepID=UPI0016749E4B|nr:ComF family protein [Paludibacterium paludis]